MSDLPVLSAKDVPFYRRPWAMVLMLLLFWPLALIIMWTGNTYYRKAGGLAPMGRGVKALISILMILGGGLYFAKLVAQPPTGEQTANDANSPSQPPGETASSDTPPAAVAGQPASGTQSSAVTSNGLEACDSDGTKASLKQILESNDVQVLDMGNFKEIKCPAISPTDASCMKTGDKDRYCNAAVYLNTGTTSIKYHMFYGPSGKPLIQVDEGSWTDWSALQKSSADRVPPSDDVSDKDYVLAVLDDARKVCPQLDDDNFDTETIKKLAQDDSSDYSKVSAFDATLLTDEDKRCWEKARQIIGPTNGN